MARQESWTWWIEKKEKVMNFAVLVPSDAEKTFSSYAVRYINMMYKKLIF